jgi:predicted RNA-binding protein
MCQTSALMEKNGSNELLFENVTNLKVMTDSIELSTLFEGSRLLTGVAIRRIDFTAGKVYLYQKE